ncbi:MAG: cupredoxin domain-containing protein [Acidimicrobiales bacterium]|nr:cupredoxin domain-containing protein [Acidimicrobiales bacterium]
MSTPDAAPDVAAATANEILIENRDFAPTELTIPVGATVRWVNNDDTQHRILSVDEGVVDSGTLPPGAVFEQRFDTPGVIEYYCDIYNFMKGTITVE